MQFTKMILSLFCSLFLWGCSSSEPVFKDSQGQSIQLSAYEGKWVIVNYWAAWCHSCIQEIPELNRLSKNNSDKIVLLGVNYDHLAPNELKAAMNKARILFPVLVEDPQKAWHLGEIAVVPTTFIINPQGKLVETVSGPTSEKLLLDKIKSLS